MLNDTINIWLAKSRLSEILQVSSVNIFQGMKMTMNIYSPIVT
jgi:hypothetical protein